MNAAFRGAAAQYQQVPPKLSHAQVVCRLYRHSLKLLDSWVIDRRIFNQEATKMRAQFNAAKGEAPDSGKVKRLLREGHEMLASYAHPDRYIKPYMPSGSLYMRNPAPPLHVCFPLGIPNHVLKEVPRELDVDMTTAEPGKMAKAGAILVDLATKRAY